VRTSVDTYLLELAARLTGDSQSSQAEQLSSYRGEDGIVAFVRDVLGAVPTAYQEDILRLVVRHRRLAVHGPHGIGKTALAAWFALWFVTVHESDAKVATAASVWRQLNLYLWPEIRKWALSGRWAMLGIEMRDGREVLERAIRLPNSRDVFPVASDTPASIEGAHAAHIAYILDEAKSIPAAIWDAVEGAFSVGDCYALAISTPGEQSGRFYEICSKRPGYEDWHVRHVTLDEFVASGRINRQWVDARRRQWGESSAVFQQRVLGQFADSAETQVIPLSWVEQANERWNAVGGLGPEDERTVFGIDPAHLGPDQTAIARRRGRVIEAVIGYSRSDTMQTAGRIKALLDQHPNSIAFIDPIGIGAGVVDRLLEQHCDVVPVDVRKRATFRDSTGLISFKNMRSALWWRLRELLDPDAPDPLALPPDPQLIGDLTAPTWSYTSSGEVIVESKDDLRARLGRSPDFGDAVCLSIFNDAAPTLKVYEPLDW